MQKKIYWLFLTIGVISLVFSLVSFFLARANTETYVVEEKYPISHIQEVWIHTLEFCESSGRANIKILDSNNKYSFGCLQFQMTTFLENGKKYELIPQELSAKEAETDEYIYNCELQEKIAHRMLLDGGERNWYNCWKNKLKSKYPI